MRDSSCGFSFHGGKTKLAREMLNAVAQMHSCCDMHAQMHAQMQEFHAVSGHTVAVCHRWQRPVKDPGFPCQCDGR